MNVKDLLVGTVLFLETKIALIKLSLLRRLVVLAVLLVYIVILVGSVGVVFHVVLENFQSGGLLDKLIFRRGSYLHQLHE